MIIANRSIHIIDYENNRILSRDIPATFDEYVGELIEHINRNDSVRDYKTRSRYTEVISGAIAISSQKDNADVVRERTNSIANRLLVKEVEAQGHIGRLNTNVQKGSLIQALLLDEQEHKHVYLLAKVEHSTLVEISFNLSQATLPDKETFSAVFALIPIRDTMKITLIIDNGDVITVRKNSSFPDKEYSTLVEDVDDETKIDVHIEINKNIESNTFSVYSFEKFTADLLEHDIKEILSFFSHSLTGKEFLVFEILEGNYFFTTESMAFVSKRDSAFNGDFHRLNRLNLSLHCRYSALTDLDEKTLSSIQSNYQIYLKDNVSQYIELKNKLAQFICDVVSKTGDYATMLLGDLKKNLIAIFGFLFTVILANIVSDQPLQNIFTREITVILEVVIAGSIIYLLICHIESQYKLCKIKRTYYLLKDNYKDLLSDVDLQESFNEDKMITDTVRSVKRGIWIYTIIWFVLLVGLLFILENTSSSPVITTWINDVVSFFHEIEKSGAH